MTSAGSCWDRLVESGVVHRNEPLAPQTTYKLGGPAALFAEVDDVATLSELGRCIAQDARPVLVLGRGSNLLVADDGFPGLVVRLGKSFSAVDVRSDGVIEAGGSVPLPRLARVASAAGRGGLEWCVGVPGSVGGAVRQNAGCFGREVVDVLVNATVVSILTGAARILTADDLGFGYRRSNVAATDVVVSARFRTEPADPGDSAEEMRRVTRWRKENQPGGTLNAGSVFKNPAGDHAGRIIDEAGLKGFEMEGVRVSPRHANFIEADQGATAAGVKRLIEEVARRVLETSGVALEPEIQFVGFDGES